MPDAPWEENEHGLWCPACGDLIAAPWQMDDDFVAPETCRQCGFPDFEDGPGYFIGEDDDEQDRCPTCEGSGSVNPLTAPKGHFVAGAADCPHCDGTGRI